MGRKFTHAPAKRERLPMLVGLVGPSGSGKTFSMLRLLTGMVKVTGGKIFVIDTEARRALHYADEFDFEHVQLDAPFSPLDYLECLEYCIAQGAGAIGVDSMSHEHEGPGGVLEMHDQFLDDKCGDDWNKRNKMTFSAWIKPKQQRAKLTGAVLRLGINGVFCFRAKEKLKLKGGQNPVHLGWQPIGGEEFIYEMLVNCLLYPKAEGVPTWDPDEKAERVMLKLPEKLKHVFREGKPISEDTGERLAKWAAGDSPPQTPAVTLDVVVLEMKQAKTIGELDSIRELRRKHTWSRADASVIKAAVGEAQTRIVRATEEPAASGEVCGKGPTGNECMRAPNHAGKCDWQS